MTHVILDRGSGGGSGGGGTTLTPQQIANINNGAIGIILGMTATTPGLAYSFGGVEYIAVAGAGPFANQADVDAAVDAGDLVIQSGGGAGLRINAAGATAADALDAAGLPPTATSESVIVFNTAPDADSGLYYAVENPIPGQSGLVWLLSELRHVAPGSMLGVSGALPIVDGVTIVGSGTVGDPWRVQANQFEHIQATPATVWAISHGLGGNVDSVNAFDASGDPINGTVDVVDNENLTITFALPKSGRAVIEL